MLSTSLVRFPQSLVRIVFNEVACDEWIGLMETRRKQIANREPLDKLQMNAGLGISLPTG